MLPEKRKERLLIIVFSIIGVGVSVLSFFLYHCCAHILITIAICIVDIIYSYFNAMLFCKAKEWNGVRPILIPLFLLMYWVIVLCLICIGNALINGGFSNSFFVYPIFLMPSFVVVIILILLLLTFLSYL